MNRCLDIILGDFARTSIKRINIYAEASRIKIVGKNLMYIGRKRKGKKKREKKRKIRVAKEVAL